MRDASDIGGEIGIHASDPAGPFVPDGYMLFYLLGAEPIVGPRQCQLFGGDSTR